MTIEIPLTRGHIAIVDNEDADLADVKWRVTSMPYLYGIRSRGRDTIWMHRIILARVIGRDLSPVEVCDHINGNGLDNRRCNLRLATHSENMRNRRINKNSASHYKGVTWHKGTRKWRAQIKKDGNKKHIGYFDTMEAAHAAYVAAARELHGEFANDGSTKPEASE